MRPTGQPIENENAQEMLQNIPDGDGALMASEQKQVELELANSRDELRKLDPQSGKIGYALLWLLGGPLPLLIIAYLIWGR